VNEPPAAGVVRVDGPEGAGTGFLVSASGLIVTCAHVLAGAAPGDSVSVKPHADRRPLKATVVLLEDPPDVAVLRLTAPVPPEVAVLPLGRSPRSRRQGLLTFGYPQVRAEAGLPGEIDVLGVTEDAGYEQLALRSEEATLGFSGAPIWDAELGAVAGMVKSIARADPGQRLGSAGFGVSTEVIRGFCRELRLPAGCPYRGLEPFTEEHADYYYGREHATSQLLASLATHDFVAVVAVSGGGKSSLLQAGLAKGLRDRPVSGLGQRVRCYQRVGGGPLAGLLDCLAQQGMSLPLRLAEASPAEVAAAVLSAAPPAGLIMVADQFERLYTECTDAERKRFTELLLHLASDTAKVVIGLRADFYHLALADLGEHLADGQVALAPMSEQELTQAIAKPAGRLLRSFQPGLAQQIAADVRGRPGDLPLLQFALTQLWDHDEAAGVLTRETYQSLGAVLGDGTHLPGAQGALINRADELWQGLSPSDRSRLQRILLGLIATQPTGTRTAILGDSPRDLGRPALRAQWDDDDQPLIQRLIDDRLLTADSTADGHATVEVSHEVLLRAWPRLRGWLERRGTYLQWRTQDLAPNLERWLNSSKSPDGKGNPEFLLPPSLLDPALRWLKGYPDELDGPPATYIRASERRRSRLVRIRRGVTAALAALAVGLAVTTVAAYNASQNADRASQVAVRQRDDAIASQLIAESEAQADTDPTASKIESLAAWQIDPGPQSRYALISAATSPGIAMLSGNAGSVDAVAFSPDGKTLATGSDDGTELWDVATRRQIGQLDEGGVDAVAFSPDGKTLATSNFDSTVRLWDVATQKPVGQPIAGDGKGIFSVAFSPDGKTLAISAGNEVVLRDTATGRQIGQPITVGTNFDTVAFSPDGRTLATGNGDDAVRLWDLASHQQIGAPFIVGAASSTDGVNSVAFSPDGQTLAAGNGDGTVRLWDVATQRQVGQPLTVGSVVNSVAFGFGGRTLAVGSGDGAVRLWDVGTGQQIVQPLATGTIVNSVAFSPDGQTLATGNAGGTVRLWDVARLNSLSLTSGTNITSVAFSPDGQTLATGSGDGARLWKVATRPLVSHPPAIGTSDNNVDPVAFSPDGRTVVTAGSNPNGTVRLWSVATHSRPLGPPLSIGELNTVADVAFSPGGQAIAVGTLGGTVRLWDVGTRRQISPPIVIRTFDAIVGTAALSPDGRTLATGEVDGTVRLWNVATQKQIGQTMAAASSTSSDVAAMALSPDGQTLATGSDDGTVRLWDVATQQQIGQTITDPGTIEALAFSPDGKTLATGDGNGNGTVRLWDVATQQQIGPSLTDTATAPRGLINAVTFTPNGQILAAASTNGVQLWNVSAVDQAFTRACGQIGGPITRAEWTQYVPAGPTYSSICR